MSYHVRKYIHVKGWKTQQGFKFITLHVYPTNPMVHGNLKYVDNFIKENHMTIFHHFLTFQSERNVIIVQCDLQFLYNVYHIFLVSHTIYIRKE